jgi:nitroreductase
MDVLTAIKDRRSIRRYTEKAVSNDVMNDLIKAGQWAPTGGNRQYWKFIAITDKNVMKMVKRASPMMWGESPAAILVCLDLTRSSIKPEGHRGYGEIAGFPSQNIMLAAYALGLGSCAIGGFNRKALIDILEIPDDLEPKLLITLGYPDEAPMPKPRRSIKEVAFLNSCNNHWRES